MRPARAMAPWPAAPAQNATIVMFATHERNTANPSVPGIDTRRIAAVTLTWLRNNQASAANGLRVYARDDGGTYRETDLNDDANPPNATIGSGAPLQIPALTSPTTRRVRVIVAHLLNGFAIEYTAATAPSQWNGIISVELDQSAVTL